MLKTIELIAGLLILMLLSCGNDKKLNGIKIESNDGNIQKINLLTLSKPQNEFMEALTSGILIMDVAGCLKIRDNTIIWPYGFKLGTNKDKIYNAKGNFVAKIGDHIELSGGECFDCSKEHIKKLIGITYNSKCHRNYWIVGEEIRLSKIK